MKFNIELTEFAKEDLINAKNFYDLQVNYLGSYFIDNILLDLESLTFFGGIHQKVYGYYRMLAKRFPFAIYYDIEKDNKVVVHAILDTRKNPQNIKERLKI